MRGKGWLIGIVVVVAIVAVALFAGRDTWATAKIGTVYVAKQTCSCLFVAGRQVGWRRAGGGPRGAARRDAEPEARSPLTVEKGDGGVKVSALAGLVSAQSKFEPGFGCH